MSSRKQMPEMGIEIAHSGADEALNTKQSLRWEYDCHRLTP